MRRTKELSPRESGTGKPTSLYESPPEKQNQQDVYMHTYLKKLAHLIVLASQRPRRGGDVVPVGV